jgi:hypothetical protein
MTERDTFEARFHDAVRGYAARVSSDLDPVGLARTIAAAEPRRRGVAGVFASRGLIVSRLAWILLVLAALLTVAASAAIVGSGLLRRLPDLTVVTPPSVLPVPTVETTRSVAPWRPALVAGPTVTRSALGTITWRVYKTWSAYGRVPVGSAHGLVMLDGLDLRWLAPDGSWPGTFLPIEARGVQAVGDGLIAFGDADAIRLSWDGARWVPGEQLELPRPLAVVNALVAGPRSAVAVGQVLDGSGAIAASTDGVHFAMAARPPDGMVGDMFGYVLATEDGFVGLVPTRDVRPAVGDPLAWTSADGSEWTPAAPPSPFGTGSEITHLASREGRHVAGGRSDGSGASVWVSDDGLRWERAAIPMPDRWVVVAAGPAGWMIVGWQGGAWVSADGRAWEELTGWPAITPRGAYEVPQIVAFGPGVVAVRGSLRDETSSVDVIAIGTIEP